MVSSSQHLFLLFIFLELFTIFTHASQVPALFAFGDSLMDTGNNNYLLTFAKANFPPYGFQFDTGRPTGRFTNGRNQIDFLASKLGLPLIPSFMDPSTHGENLLQGVNFASAGSGILDFTNLNAGQLIHITEQVKNFGKVKEELVQMLGEEKASELVSASLFCIFTGNNDFTMTFPFTSIVRSSSSGSRFQNLLISKLLEQTRELYNFGARKLVVAGVGAVGCAPAQLSRYGSLSCVKFLDRPVMKYNSALQAALSELNDELPDSRIVYSDLYMQMTSILMNPTQYGFKYVREACCGAFKQMQSCLPGAPVCENVSEYYFWDSYHPSTKTCELLVDMLYSRDLPYNYPVGVGALVQGTGG